MSGGEARKRKEGDSRGKTQAMTKQKRCRHHPGVGLWTPVALGPEVRSGDTRGRGRKSYKQNKKQKKKKVIQPNANKAFIFGWHEYFYFPFLYVYTFIFPQL